MKRTILKNIFAKKPAKDGKCVCVHLPQNEIIQIIIWRVSCVCLYGIQDNFAQQSHKMLKIKLLDKISVPHMRLLNPSKVNQ